MTWCLPPFACIFPCAISATKETDATWIPQLKHPLLELDEVLAFPSFIVAHEFGCLSKLITVEPEGKACVAITRHLGGGVAPIHEHIHSVTCTRLVAFNLPTESILIGDGCTTGCIDVVFARTTSTDNGYNWIGGCARLCIGCRLEHLISSCDGWVAISQLLLDAVEVCLRVQATRMLESSILCK